jgi:hypothetical protein
VVAVQAGKAVRKCGNPWCRQAGHTKATCQTIKPPAGAAAAGGAAAAIAGGGGAAALVAGGESDSDDDGEFVDSSSSDDEGGDDEDDDGGFVYEDNVDIDEDNEIDGAASSSYASSGILPSAVATGPSQLAADIILADSNMVLSEVRLPAFAAGPTLPALPRPDLAVGVRVRLNLIRGDDLDILRNDRGSSPIQGRIIAVRNRTFIVMWLTSIGVGPTAEYAANRLYALLRLEYNEEEA